LYTNDANLFTYNNLNKYLKFKYLLQGLKPFSKPISETGISHFKTETETVIKTGTEKNWISVFKSKPKPEKIEYRYSIQNQNKKKLEIVNFCFNLRVFKILNT